MNKDHTHNYNHKFIIFGLILAALLVTIWTTHIGILRHLRLESRDFDLGVIGNVISNTAKGNLFRSSYYGGQSFLGVHFVPIYLVIALIFAANPSVYLLLFIQNFAVSVAVLPLYLILIRIGVTKKHAILFGVLYLLHPLNFSASVYDFHEIAFLPLTLFLFCYSWVCHQFRSIYIYLSLFILLSVKEDAAIVLIFLLPALNHYYKRNYIEDVLLISIVWYLVACLAIYLLGGESHPYSRYYSDLYYKELTGVIGIVVGIIADPIYLLKSRLTLDRLIYLVCVIGPFIPFIYKKYHLILALLFGLTVTLLSSNERFELFSTSFHYVWYIVPSAFVVLALSSKQLSKLQALYFFVFIIGLNFYLGGIFNPNGVKVGYRTITTSISDEQLLLVQNINALKQKLPYNDPIVCSMDICPHLIEFTNALPCRIGKHVGDFDIKWAFVGQDKNCSQATLSRLGFQVYSDIGRYRLMRR